MSKRGKLIVIDGIDGSGKATQAKLLVKNLRKSGKKVELISFPQYAKESSVLIREYLNGDFGSFDEVGPRRGSVFYAIDRYAASFKIRGLLKDGYWVIADRYVSSNKGHQASKIHSRKDRFKYLVWLNEFEYEIMGIPVPDKTVYISVPAEVAHQNILERSRKEGRKIDIHDNLKHLKKAERTYQEMVSADPYENWIVLEAATRGQMKPVEEIQNKLLQLLGE